MVGNYTHDRFMLPHFLQLDWEDVMSISLKALRVSGGMVRTALRVSISGHWYGHPA